MNDLISRSELEQVMEEELWISDCTKNIVSILLDKLPEVDAVPVRHGQWVWDNRFFDYTCSECHHWDLKTPNYCSNCGAKMDKE